MSHAIYEKNRYDNVFKDFFRIINSFMRFMDCFLLPSHAEFNFCACEIYFDLFGKSVFAVGSAGHLFAGIAHDSFSAFVGCTVSAQFT